MSEIVDHFQAESSKCVTHEVLMTVEKEEEVLCIESQMWEEAERGETEVGGWRGGMRRGGKVKEKKERRNREGTR